MWKTGYILSQIDFLGSSLPVTCAEGMEKGMRICGNPFEMRWKCAVWRDFSAVDVTKSVSLWETGC